MANPNKPEQPRSDETTNPARPKTVQSSQPHSGESYRFRCADAGHQECPWETRGSSPDEVLHSAEQHAREQHQVTGMDQEMRNQVRSKIQRAA